MLAVTPYVVNVSTDRIAVPDDVSDGSAVLLVHEEDAAMRDLRQIALRGAVADGVLTVSSRRGSLTPQPKSATDEVRSLLQLARAAKTNRSLLATWPQYEPSNGPHR